MNDMSLGSLAFKETRASSLALPKYRPDIDGLRALAVLSVVIFHAFPEFMRGGFIGVDIFFVISGYLISTIIFQNLERGTFSFREFYVRRIRRIFPALFLVLAACYCFGWFFLLADEYKQLGKHIAASAGFIQNFVLWNEAGYFDNSAETKPLLHIWSLGIEEQFYLIWPFVLWFAWKQKFNPVLVISSLAIISFLMNIIQVKSDDVATFYSPQTRFWELLIGSILAWVNIYHTNSIHKAQLKTDQWFATLINSVTPEEDRTTFANILAFAGFFLLAFAFWRITKESQFPGWWALAPVLGTVFIISAGSEAWLNRTILSNKIAVGFGLISFPLYLWHWPILSFASIIETSTPNSIVRICIIYLSLLLAFLTYKFFELPIRFGNKEYMKVRYLVVCLFLVGSLGSITFLKDGIGFRAVELTAKQMRTNNKKDEDRLRTNEIRSGICHFNGEGKYKDINHFVENWSCLSNDEGLLDSRALVFGDSHSADKAMGLRLNGIDVVQIGGSGCPLNPALMTGKKEFCYELLKLVRRNEKNFDKIFLSNRFGIDQISKENIYEILEFWTGDKDVYIFTPMPSFTSQMNEYLKNGKISSNPNFEAEKKFLAILKDLRVPENIHIIMTSDLWCKDQNSSPNNPCSYQKNGHLLMVDGGHLSVNGAKIFGSNLLNNAILSQALHGRILLKKEN